MTPARAIVVLGPTGAGKSELALTLAKDFNGEIVNCDSVQLYRYLDIGSAKTPAELRRGVPHHLIDVLNPDEHFSAGDYARAARPILSEIAARGKIPVIAGGTGFYLRALLEGLSPGPPRDVALRQRLASRNGASLHKLLVRLDPGSAARIHPNDTSKVIRALEICILTRSPATRFFRHHESQPLEGFEVHKIGLDPPAQELAERIDERCRQMFRAGLIEEVQHVLSLGYSPSARALTSIGYREAVEYLRGELSLEEALAKAQTATRQYAKRQRTWFRRESGVFSIRSFANEHTVSAVLDYLDKIIHAA